MNSKHGRGTLKKDKITYFLVGFVSCLLFALDQTICVQS